MPHGYEAGDVAEYLPERGRHHAAWFRGETPGRVDEIRAAVYCGAGLYIKYNSFMLFTVGDCCSLWKIRPTLVKIVYSETCLKRPLP